jgi:hypothetical protein
MRIGFTLGVASMLVSFGAGAQQLTPMTGKWTGSVVPTHGGKQIQVELKVEESSATYKASGSANDIKHNPCLGRERPASITTRRASPNEVTLHVEAGEIADCPKFTVRLTRVDDKTLEGVMKNGSSVRLTR